LAGPMGIRGSPSWTRHDLCPVDAGVGAFPAGGHLSGLSDGVSSEHSGADFPGRHPLWVHVHGSSGLLGGPGLDRSRIRTPGFDWVDQDWIGHGFAPLALAMVANWVFKDRSGPHLHRLEVAILPENQRSLRVVQKLGMEPEGLRRSYMYVNGQWRDHLTFAWISDQFDPDLLARL